MANHLYGRAECALDPTVEPFTKWVKTSAGAPVLTLNGTTLDMATSNGNSMWFSRSSTGSFIDSPWVAEWHITHLDEDAGQHQVGVIIEGFTYKFEVYILKDGGVWRLYYGSTSTWLVGHDLSLGARIVWIKTGDPSLGTDTWKIWVNGVLEADDVAKAQAGAGGSYSVRWGNTALPSATSVSRWDYLRYKIGTSLLESSWDFQIDHTDTSERYQYDIGMTGDGLIVYDGLGISLISPSEGITLGGEEVVITGESFYDGVIVTMGGVPCFTTRVISAREIRIATPPLAAGTHDIVIIGPYGDTVTVTDAISVTVSTCTVARAKALMSYLPSEIFDQTLSSDTLQRGIMVALARELCRFLERVAESRENISISDATGDELENIGNHYGVGRVITDMTDALYRDFIKTVAWAPRGTVKTLRDALECILGYRPDIYEPATGKRRYFEVVIPELASKSRWGYYGLSYWSYHTITGEYAFPEVETIIEKLKMAGVNYKLVAKV